MKKLLTLFSPIMAGIVGLLPVVSCPACWPLYAGFMSSLGIGFIDYTPYQSPILLFLVFTSLASLAWSARKRKAYSPFILGFMASILIIIVKLSLLPFLHSFYQSIFYFGLGALLIATIWSLFLRQPQQCQDCHKE